MALAGDLGEFPFTDIIQLVDLSKKTGGVFIQGTRGSQQFEGWVYFRDGKIIGAKMGNMPPLEAVYTLFTLSAGPFRFHEDAVLDKPTITSSNEIIIMEGIMYQEQWAKQQEQMPPPTMIPRLVPNPSATGAEISLEADEWRVLTMVNGKNSIGFIAQRSGLGEMRTCEIIMRLLESGLIEKRDVNLSESLFPELERIATTALGASARALLQDTFARAGITDQDAATPEQVGTAIDTFDVAATRAFGLNRVRDPLMDMRELVQRVFATH